MTRQSIKLDASRDFEMEETDEGVDFKTVEGAEEVAQSLEIRLLTREGEDPHFPNAGLNVRGLVGPVNESAIEAELKSEVLKEPKVAEVTNIRVDFVSVVGRRIQAEIEYVDTEGNTGTATLSGV